MDFFDNYIIDPRRHGWIIVFVVLGLVAAFVIAMLVLRVPTVKPIVEDSADPAQTQVVPEDSSDDSIFNFLDNQEYYESME
jgi:hypothetical protein